MNYTVDISSSDAEYKKAVNKLSQPNKVLSKNEVSSYVKDVVKALNLDKCRIKTTETNLEFELLKGTQVKAKISAIPNSKTEKIVVKFAEHKYFKNLKYLFGTYKTELSQDEGSSAVTTDAYIRGVLGANFHATDLTSSDKFVKVDEIDLRSPYMEALNNVLFQSTRRLEGEVYGISEDLNLLVAGKRNKPFKRLYDYDLMSSLDDITPAIVVNNEVLKDPSVTAEVDFDFESIERPKYMNAVIKESLNSSYNQSEAPQFKYYKNLLVFEAKVNLASPRVAERPDFDEGEFQLVTNALQPGDTIESAIALDGSGSRTHTITTQIRKTCKYLAANGSDLIAIMGDNSVWTAKDVNFEAVNSITMTKEDGEFAITGAQLIDMIYSEEEQSWVGTFGFEGDKGTDFYGDTYYRFMISKSLTSALKSGNEGSYMYAEIFSSQENTKALTFKDKSSDNKIKIATGKAVKVVDNYGAALGVPSTSLVKPEDLAISVYTETDVTATQTEIPLGPIVEVGGKKYLQNITEGPYVVDPDEYKEDNSKMYQKIFSDGDVDIVLQQNYIFVKNKLYTVTEDGAYTRDLTRDKHWLAAKMPVTLDGTMLKLRSMPVRGITSCYNWVLDDIKTFCSWALDTAQKSEIGGDEDKWTFTDMALDVSYTEDELTSYKKAIQPLSGPYSGTKTEGRGLLDYATFCSMTVKYFSGTDEVTGLTVDSYSVSEKHIDKIIIDTGLPLTADLKVDDTVRFELVGTKENGVIIQSGAFKNAINWEELYRLYLFHALTYVRGIRQYDVFGAKLVTEIYSFGNKIYFRCYTGDIFFIEKQYLHKAADIENQENWRVSIMPAMTFINGWDAEDLKDWGGYETVTLKTGKLLAVNNKEHRVYFFKTTTKMFTMPDNRHIFFGGFAYPAKDIYDKYAAMGGGAFDTTQDWWKLNLENWIAADETSGKTPIVLYSNDAGATFNMLPVRTKLPENIFNDGIDRQVKYFSETPEGKIAAYVSEGEALNSNQIVMDFDLLTGNVDSTLTEWRQVGIPVSGEVREFYTDEGKIRYTTGRVGFGVDIDASEMRGADTFNFDFTGNTTITLPEGLKVQRVESGNAIRFNKAISDELNSAGTYRILFAAFTKTDVPLQETYLSSNSSILSDYLKNNGRLKVDSIKRVQNSLNANKMYASGFPTIAEDTSKTYYEYEDGKVVELTNSYSNKIIQCSEDGDKYVIKIGAGDETYIDFASSLGNGISENQLVAAGKPAHSLDDFLTKADYMKTEETLTALINNGKSYLSMSGYNQDGLFANFDANASALADVLADYGIKETDTQEYEDFSSFIESFEDTWGGPDNSFASASERFEFKAVTGSADKFLFDKKYGVFAFGKKYYIVGTLSLPYTFYNGGTGTTVVPDPIIEYDETHGNMIGAGALCNGIFYHPKGYGGLRNNNSYTSTTPWKRDPVAFEDDYLKNSVGDYVFLTDNQGSKIRVYDACQLLDEDEYEITYNSFLNDGNNVVTNGDTVSNYYKLTRTEIHQCHTCDYVKSGSKVGLRFYKNTKRVTSVHFEDGTDNGFLYNKSGDKCYEATIENGMLAVGDPLNAAGKVLTAKFKVGYSIKGKSFEEVVTSSFNLSGSNSTPWVDSISDDEDTIFYYKGYGLITDTDAGQATKSESYEITLTDNDGEFDFSKADVIKNNIEATLNDDGSIRIDFAAGMENVERSLTVNGTTVWRAPIVELSDEIISRDKVYLGDDEISSGVSAPQNFIKTLPNDYTVLYLGYENTVAAKTGDIVVGAYGFSISKKPKYDTFKNLLFREGTIIEKDVSYSENELTTVRVGAVASDNSSVKLNKPVSFGGGKYNDGNEHYFRFKILTIAEQDLAPKLMNNPDYYYELSKEQMKNFTPNRVWFNPKGSPVPPITVGSKIFNAENNYAYYSNNYKNNNGINIYLCDENGRFINYNEEGEAYTLDNGDGDCSKNVYIGVDNRYISPEPINPTCQDWFYENMYTPNAEINPLWQVIRIAPKIENKKWTQTVQLCRFKKNGNSQLLSPDVEYPYVTINELSQIIAENGQLKVDDNFNAFNMEKGKVSLLLSEGSDYYAELANSNGDMTLFGLNFKVDNIKDMYNENEYNLASTLKASYTVNTLRDFTTDVQDDSTIARITEMGVFDKNHRMIAYAQFPPIEYRTDCQHAAFTAVIYHGNMTAD